MLNHILRVNTDIDDMYVFMLFHYGSSKEPKQIKLNAGCVPYFVCLNIKISRLVYNRDYINFTSFRFLGRRFSKIERVVFTFQCYDKLHHWHKRAAFVFVILVHCARNSLFT